MLLYFIHYLQEVFSIFSSPIILYIIIAILAKNNYEVNIITKFNVILITKFNVILKNHVIRTISTKNFMESRTIQFLELRCDSVKITMGHYKLTYILHILLKPDYANKPGNKPNCFLQVFFIRTSFMSAADYFVKSHKIISFTREFTNNFYMIIF